MPVKVVDDEPSTAEREQSGQQPDRGMRFEVMEERDCNARSRTIPVGKAP